MTDYPPGSIGFQFDELEQRLQNLAMARGVRAWPLRVWARNRLRYVQVVRERMREQSIETLRREGFLP